MQDSERALSHFEGWVEQVAGTKRSQEKQSMVNRVTYLHLAVEAYLKEVKQTMKNDYEALKSEYVSKSTQFDDACK